MAYLAFFSVAATKLPNYILPLYPAAAILTARFLIAWRVGALALPRWLMPVGVGALAVTAAAVGGGLLVAGGAVAVLPVGARVFPGLATWAPIALVPLATAAALVRALRSGDRGQFVRSAAVGSVVFTGLMAAFPALAVDSYKAPKELVRDSGVDDPARDLRLAHCGWFQPSLVFYSRREVVEAASAEAVAEFLAVPTPGYVFVPEDAWEERVKAKVSVPTRVAARHYDFYRNCAVLVVTNSVE